MNDKYAVRDRFIEVSSSEGKGGRKFGSFPMWCRNRRSGRCNSADFRDDRRVTLQKHVESFWSNLLKAEYFSVFRLALANRGTALWLCRVSLWRSSGRIYLHEIIHLISNALLVFDLNNIFGLGNFWIYWLWISRICGQIKATASKWCLQIAENWTVSIQKRACLKSWRMFGENNKRLEKI